MAAVLGTAHGLFWHRRGRARRLLGAGVMTGVRAVLVLAVLALLPVAARAPEGSPTYAAVEDKALGLRALVGIARRATDGDGDGHSARFGGGDCDDRRADSFPGAEEIPGDGIDQNCQGGDATGTAVAVGSGGAAPRGRRPRWCAGRATRSAATCSSSASMPCAPIAWAWRATSAARARA